MFLNKDRGYMLLTVIIFLQILACLGVYGLLSVSTSLRSSEHRMMRETNFLAAKQALREVERAVMVEGVTCLIPVTLSSDLANKPLDWWQQKACYMYQPNYSYYYVIEWLQDDECGLIGKYNENHILTAKYYRITLFTVFADMKAAKLILQSTLAKASINPLSCFNKTHLVISGMQMMREL
jgi:hypothetical protein